MQIAAGSKTFGGGVHSCFEHLTFGSRGLVRLLLLLWKIARPTKIELSGNARHEGQLQFENRNISESSEAEALYVFYAFYAFYATVVFLLV